MGEFVNFIRNKLGLEPERDKTVTGKTPNEVVVQRAIQKEVWTGPIPTQGARDDFNELPPPGKHDLGRDSNIPLKTPMDKINAYRRRAIKRNSLDLPEESSVDALIDARPGIPTPVVNSIPTVQKRGSKVKSEGLFAADVDEKIGNPNHPMYEIKPVRKKIQEQIHQYIIEARTKISKTRQKADSVGKLAEILIAKHLNGGTHPDHHRAEGKSPQDMHDLHAQNLYGKEYAQHPSYKALDRAAKTSANQIRKHASKHLGIDRIDRTAWTSQPGDHEKETDVKDPNSKSDIIITQGEGKKRKQASISIKSQQSNSKKQSLANLSNNGLSTLSKHAGVDIGRKIKEAKEQHLSLVAKRKVSDRESFNRSPHKREIIESSKNLQREAAGHYRQGISKKLKTDSDFVEHIKKSVGAMGHVQGGDADKGMTHLPTIMSSIRLHNDGSHDVETKDYHRHVHEYLNNYEGFHVDPSDSQSVAIKARHKKTGQIHNVFRTTFYAGGLPETGQVRTQTKLPSENHRDNANALREEYSLVEHVKSIISEAKNKEDLHEDEDRGSDSKGHFRSTEAGAGMTKKGVEAYRRKNPGSKLSTAVTTPPSKLKPGSKAANRRKSFCARMSGMPGPMKDEKGRPTRKAMSLRRWNCEASEILKTIVEAKKMKGKDPCWKNYEMVGTKEKDGRTVPNCVPEEDN